MSLKRQLMIFYSNFATSYNRYLLMCIHGDWGRVYLSDLCVNLFSKDKSTPCFTFIFDISIRVMNGFQVHPIRWRSHPQLQGIAKVQIYSRALKINHPIHHVPNKKPTAAESLFDSTPFTMVKLR